MGEHGTDGIRLWCPSCGTALEVPFGALAVTCGKCGREVDLSKRAASMGAATAGAAEAMAEAARAADFINDPEVLEKLAEAKRAAEAAKKASEEAAAVAAEAALVAKANAMAMERGVPAPQAPVVPACAAPDDSAVPAQSGTAVDTEAVAPACGADAAGAPTGGPATSSAGASAPTAVPAATPAPAIPPIAPTPIRDAAGRTLVTMPVPQGWRTARAILDASQTSDEWPFTVLVNLVDDATGAAISYRSNEQWIDNNPAMQQANRMYGSGTGGNPTQYERDFPTPSSFLDYEAARQLQGLTDNARCIGQLAHADIAQAGIGPFQRMQVDATRQQAAEAGVQVSVDAVLYQPYTRIYEFDRGGHPWRIAVHTVFQGAKRSLVGGGFGMAGLGGAIGGMLSSLIGGNKAGAGAQAAAGGGMPAGGQGAPMPGQQAGAAIDAQAASFANMGSMGMQFIQWGTSGVYTLMAPAESFDALFANLFDDLCFSTELDPGLLQARGQANLRAQQEIRAATQRTLQQQQAAFAASQQAFAAQQAAHDAQMQSYWEQSEAHHQAYRERQRAEWGAPGEPIPSTAAERYSEAIRGVNTWVDKYGDEHELNVSAERAWQSDSGEIIGTPTGVEPGYGWTELDKKN